MQSFRRAEYDVPVLVVQGVVIYMSRSPRPAPPLMAIVRDQSGKELTHWVFNPEADVLGPGASSGFQSESFDPTSDAVKITITFAPVERAAQ